MGGLNERYFLCFFLEMMANDGKWWKIDEEYHLIRFFGQSYIDYQRTVGTWLPWYLVDTGSSSQSTPLSGAKISSPKGFVKVEGKKMD